MKNLMQHLHIYQPRGNDKWTKKINEQCYKPITKSDVLRHTSFNIGPTLMDWFAENDSETLERIISLDTGQVVGQTYNHRIMPLVRFDEDLKTQIVWGKKHFKKYFGRDPKGMWLPETATSKRVCRALVDEGIDYTIGAPWQMKRNDCDDENSILSKPYNVDLGNDKSITYFFYHPESGHCAFDDEIDSATHKHFLDDVEFTLDYLGKKIEHDGDMMLLAYDGETFGHHHPFADNWEAYLPTAIAKRDDIDMISIDEYLKKFLVTEWAEINDNSSWSCFHNLDRWKKGCDCSGGVKEYQEPMLEALEKVEDKVHDVFSEEGGKILKNVWDARNDYIDTLIGNKSKEEFLNQHLKQSYSEDVKEKVMTLLEAEHHNQLAFTSCGWFFGDLSMQAEANILDGYRALEKVQSVTGENLTSGYMDDVSRMRDVKEVTGKQVLEDLLLSVN